VRESNQLLLREATRSERRETHPRRSRTCHEAGKRLSDGGDAFKAHAREADGNHHSRQRGNLTEERPDIRAHVIQSCRPPADSRVCEAGNATENPLDQPCELVGLDRLGQRIRIDTTHSGEATDKGALPRGLRMELGLSHRVDTVQANTLASRVVEVGNVMQLGLERQLDTGHVRHGTEES